MGGCRPYVAWCRCLTATVNDVSHSDLVLLERRDDGVAIITLNNPKVNALSQAVLAALCDIAHELTLNAPGAVVVTGGERIFAAGADISEFGGAKEARRIGAGFHDALNAVAAIPAFTIAAVSGFALGGGCELALACDYRIGAPKATFGQPEILLGIIPGGGGTQRLPRLIGASRAKEIMVTGRQVQSEEALRIGLLNELVGAEQLQVRALELAAQIAKGATVAVRIIKEAVDAGMSGSLADGLSREMQLFEDVFHSEDSQRGVKSFLENGPGKATFKGN